MNRLKVPIDNLTCAGCVNHIERIMRQEDGVVWAMVNFAASEATVIYDPTEFQLTRFIKALKRQGYQLGLENELASQLSKRRVGLKLYEWVQQWFGSLFDLFTTYPMASGDIRKTSQPDF